MQKVKFNDQIVELTDCTHWEVRNNTLYNCNTKHDEGVEGDIIEYTDNGVKYRGHVEGYTCFQFVATKEWGKIILSAVEYRQNPPVFIHNTPVYPIDMICKYDEEPIPEPEIDN